MTKYLFREEFERDVLRPVLQATFPQFAANLQCHLEVAGWRTPGDDATVGGWDAPQGQYWWARIMTEPDHRDQLLFRLTSVREALASPANMWTKLHELVDRLELWLPTTAVAWGEDVVAAAMSSQPDVALLEAESD